MDISNLPPEMQAEIEESRKKTAAAIERLRERSHEMQEKLFGKENAAGIVKEIALLGEDESPLGGVIPRGRAFFICASSEISTPCISAILLGLRC